MDTRDRYRRIVQDTLMDIARIPYSHGDIQCQPVFDTERDHYVLLVVGWDKRRVHGCTVHLDVIDGKIWVQRDDTDFGVVEALEDAGVPKDHIVLAFHPPRIREETGYAVA
jgi:hypothetical protein